MSFNTSIYPICDKRSLLLANKALVKANRYSMCSYQFNGTIESYPGARNTSSIICSFG